MPPGANASPATKIRSASYEMLSNISTHVALGLAIEFRKGAAHVPSPFDLVVFLSSPDKPYFQRVQSPLWPRKKSGKAVLALLFPPGEDGFHISASESTTAPPLPTTTTSVDAAVEALFGQPSASASAATSAPLPSFPSNLHVLAGLATSPQHSTQAFQDLLNFVPELPGAHSWT
ncbi:hypothetical protein OC842_004787 [Tilletia horrida]|uniref:Uncharacterized protein n=1 Tax=Tilletia horrida TaxID=155126 RepID=A0AAN6GDK4_9BASI|nr:hypothetical protein OC842_004787 [Tilletia horrida]